MRYSALLFISLLALVACKNVPTIGQDPNTIEYNVQGNEYAVVVVKTEGMSDSEVKKLALKRAAQLAQKNNYRYFAVEKEEDVQAMSTKGAPGKNPRMPHNLYYEEIQSGDFSRQQFEEQNYSQTRLYPAYRITFKCYSEYPSGGAIDTCTLIECEK